MFVTVILRQVVYAPVYYTNPEQHSCVAQEVLSQNFRRFALELITVCFGPVACTFLLSHRVASVTLWICILEDIAVICALLLFTGVHSSSLPCRVR